MKSVAANDNSRVKQTMLRYFKRVAILRDKHCTAQMEASVTFFASVFFNITISFEMDPPMLFRSCRGLEKTFTFEFSLTRIFTSFNSNKSMSNVCERISTSIKLISCVWAPYAERVSHGISRHFERSKPSWRSGFDVHIAISTCWIIAENCHIIRRKVRSLDYAI